MAEHSCATPVIWWWTRNRRWTCVCGREFWMDEDFGGRFWSPITRFNRPVAAPQEDR